jgi:hypothetical protein
MKREIKKITWLICGTLPLLAWGSNSNSLKNEEPTETEIRRLQTQLNVLDSRISDPTIIEQRRVLQDELFQKIRRMHDNNRQEKDLVGEISAKKQSEPVHEPEAPAAEQPKISTSSRQDTSAVTSMKVTPPQPRVNTAPEPVSNSSSSAGSKDDPADIYRSIINYSATNSSRSYKK